MGKRKGKTYAQLKKALDAAFSVRVRSDSADIHGIASCVTCRERRPWKILQCGHFVSRVHLATRWDERNCAPQCFACNVWKRGSPAEFALYLQGRYGPGIIQELVDKKHQTVKFTRADLEAKLLSLS